MNSVETSVPLLDRIIRILLYCYVFSFPINIAAGNFFIDSATILSITRILLQRHDLHPDRKIIGALFFYVLVLFFSVFRADQFNVGLRQAFSAFYYMVPPFLLAHLFIQPQKRFYYLGIMIVTVVASSLYGYAQALYGFPWSFGFIDRLELAGNLSQALPILALWLGERVVPRSTPRIRVLLFLAFMLCTAALILTGRRGAWLAVGFSLLVYLMYYAFTVRKAFRFIVALLVVILLLAGSLSVLPTAKERMLSLTNPHEYSVVTRFAMWTCASRMFVDQPFFGVGLGNYADRYLQQYYDPEPWEQFGKDHDGLTHKHPHNIYLYLLAETGLVGFLAFLLLVGCVFRHFYQLLLSGSQTTKFFAKMALLIFIAYLSFGMTENLVFGMYPAVQSLWFLLGMLWSDASKS